MYKITIEKTILKTRMGGMEWKPTGKQFADGKNEFAYTPEIEKQVEATEEVYTQVVDDLDLVAVIEAVNNPKRAGVK